MKRHLAAVALAATLAQPAAAVTFPSLTTIYVGSGVYDDGGSAALGNATAIHCSNVSGVAASVRVLILSQSGTVVGSGTQPLQHGQTLVFTTHAVSAFVQFLLNTGSLKTGVVNVESTQSAVFCTAMIVEADSVDLNGVQIHLVRVNAHPGTVE